MGIQAAELESIKAFMPPDIPRSSLGTVSDAAHSKELAAVAVTAAANGQQGALGVEISLPSASAASSSGVDGKAASAGERWGASWVDQVGISLRDSAAVRALGARCMLQKGSALRLHITCGLHRGLQLASACMLISFC